MSYQIYKDVIWKAKSSLIPTKDLEERVDQTLKPGMHAVRISGWLWKKVTKEGRHFSDQAIIEFSNQFNEVWSEHFFLYTKPENQEDYPWKFSKKMYVMLKSMGLDTKSFNRIPSLQLKSILVGMRVGLVVGVGEGYRVILKDGRWFVSDGPTGDLFDEGPWLNKEEADKAARDAGLVKSEDVLFDFTLASKSDLEANRRLLDVQLPYSETSRRSAREKAV